MPSLLLWLASCQFFGFAVPGKGARDSNKSRNIKETNLVSHGNHHWSLIISYKNSLNFLGGASFFLIYNLLIVNNHIFLGGIGWVPLDSHKENPLAFEEFPFFCRSHGTLCYLRHGGRVAWLNETALRWSQMMFSTKTKGISRYFIRDQTGFPPTSGFSRYGSKFFGRVWCARNLSESTLFELLIFCRFCWFLRLVLYSYTKPKGRTFNEMNASS